MRGLFTPQALDLPAFAADLHASSDLHVVLLDQAARPIFHDDTAHVNFDPVAVLGQRSGVNRSLRSESGYGPQGIRYYR
jgi:hypothetical protein